MTIISERFKRPIVVHVVRNRFASKVNVPLILGVHGPSGTGKTYQCRKVLEEIGSTVVHMSGAEFEHPDSGVPVLKLHNQYIAASDLVQDRRSPSAVLLIDDIDGGIGDLGARYTIHRQQVSTALMHLADEPRTVSIDDPDGVDRGAKKNIATIRVPIIATGNNFSSLYGPLTRYGRMSLFEWSPTSDELLAMVSGLFSRLGDGEAKQLIDTVNALWSAHQKVAAAEDANGYGRALHPLPTIAFYKELASRTYDDAIWEYSKSTGLNNLMGKLDKIRIVDIKDVEPNYRMLETIAIRMINESRISNHLSASGEENGRA